MTEDILAQWSRDVAILMAQRDAPGLPALVADALRRLVSFDLSCVFAYPDGRAPLLLHDGLLGVGEAGALAAYLNGTYLLDPFYLACSRRATPGLYRMRTLAPDAFFESDYFRSPSVHPCISMQSGSLAEEIGYLVPLPPGYMAAFSLMRSHGGEPFSEPEMARLRSVEPVVAQALALHWRHLPRAPGTPGRPLSADGELEDAFETFAADRLTRQQRRIVQLVLRGHSTGSVAARLGIAEATVKTHRKAIYARLGVSSQSALFLLFVRHLHRIT